MKRARDLICAVFCAHALAACASFSTHMTPRPTPKGVVEVTAHVDAQTYHEDGDERQALPSIEMQIRYGLAQTVDIGGKLGFLSGEINSKIALLIADELDLSVVPSAGFTAVATTSGREQALLATFGAPVLAGIHVGRQTTLLVGLKLHFHVGRDSIKQTIGNETTRSLGDSELIFYPGGVLGIEVGLTDELAIFPEINFLFPYLSSHAHFARPVWQGGIAFQFRIAS